MYILLTVKITPCCNWKQLSDIQSLNVMSKSGHSRGKGHVHELRLSVHLESTKDGFIKFVFNGELFSLVLWVGLQGGEHLWLLSLGEFLSWDDSDLLLLVKFLVKLAVSVGNVSNVYKSLVLSQNFKEFQGHITEWSSLLKAFIEQQDFLLSYSLVLGEETESLTVGEEFLEVLDIFENVVECRHLGGLGEKNSSVPSFNGIFSAWWLMIWGRVNLFDVSKIKWLEQVLWNGIVLNGPGWSTEVSIACWVSSLLSWSWGWFWRSLSGVNNIFRLSVCSGREVSDSHSLDWESLNWLDKLMESTSVELFKSPGDHI